MQERIKKDQVYKHEWNTPSMPAVEAWLEFDVSNNDVFKKETCQNMSQHVNVNLTFQEHYGPKWHVQRLLWAMTAASLACPHRGQFAHLPKVNGGFPHCPYGLPFCLTGWAGYWQLWFMRRKGSKGAPFVFFQNPFPVEANFGNDFGFCQWSDGSIWYVLYWRCIDFVLWIHCLAMPAFQAVEGRPFIQDFILKSDRRGEGLMFHHVGVVTYSSNVLQTLSLYISYM